MALITTSNSAQPTGVEWLENPEASEVPFFAFGKRRTIKAGDSTEVIELGDDIDVLFVGEGEAKPVKGSVTKKTASTKKLAFIVVETEEVEAQIAAAEKIAANAPDYFVRSISRYIAGERGTVTNFDTFKNAPESVVTTYASLAAAIGKAKNPNALVLSNSMYYSLLGLVGEDGHPVFPSLQGAVPNLLGLQVKTFDSPEAIGFVGNFSNTVWGYTIAPPRIGREGIVVDSVSSVTHNLLQDNKVAYILEAYVSYTTGRAANVQKLVLAPPVSTED